MKTCAHLHLNAVSASLLAAAGRSNKEIADELSLSVRTVEGRLQRAYDRLGVGSRAELAEAFARSGSTIPRPETGASPLSATALEPANRPEPVIAFFATLFS
jgi:DNA-binding CsgD family transcriptional regulator